MGGKNGAVAHLATPPITRPFLPGLAASLPHVPQLTSLALADCALGGAGVSAVAAALPSLPHLQSLSLSGNQAGPAASQALADALSSGAAPRLASLDLQVRVIMGGKGAPWTCRWGMTMWGEGAPSTCRWGMTMRGEGAPWTCRSVLA